MRSARFTPSPNRSWFSSSTMTSPRCTPMRNISFCSSSSSSLNCAMRSWMSIAAATAASGQVRIRPAWHRRAVDHRAAGAFDGWPPDLASHQREMTESEVLLAFGQADEAGEVGVKDCGQAASRDVHGDAASKGRKAAQFKSEARQTLCSASRHGDAHGAKRALAGRSGTLRQVKVVPREMPQPLRTMLPDHRQVHAGSGGFSPNLVDYDATLRVVRLAVRPQGARRPARRRPEHGARGGDTSRRRGPRQRGLPCAISAASGSTIDITFAELDAAANRFANVLETLGIGRGEAVFSLSGRVPGLYIGRLGTLKRGAVFCPLFSAFGPEPIRARLEIGHGACLVTTRALFQRKVAGLLEQAARPARRAADRRHGGRRARPSARAAAVCWTRRSERYRRSRPPARGSRPAALHQRHDRPAQGRDARARGGGRASRHRRATRSTCTTTTSSGAPPIPAG